MKVTGMEKHMMDELVMKYNAGLADPEEIRTLEKLIGGTLKRTPQKEEDPHRRDRP